MQQWNYVYTSTRWRMNTSLLQDKSFKTSLCEDLKSFLELNIGSTQEIATVGEASEVYIWGKLIAYAAQKKKDNQTRLKKIE